jgi:hypothetical protein
VLLALSGKPYVIFKSRRKNGGGKRGSERKSKL